MNNKTYQPLLPVSNCPFCGSGAKMYELSMGERWVRCSNMKTCGVSMPYVRLSPEECKERWDRRK